MVDYRYRCLFVAGLVCLVYSTRSVQAQTILYVDKNATGPEHDGWSWCTAFTDLQDALDLAVWNVIIRVADGTYTPDQGTGDRTASFRLETMVALEGGYAGCGSANPDERDVERYETILSGDLAADDVRDLDDPSRAENSYHVVRGGGTARTAVLDGFTITAGNADGGGLLIDSNGSPTVANCMFIRNTARGGGGIYLSSHSSPVVTNCRFTSNWAGDRGGGMFSGTQGSPTVTDCTFEGNWANQGGAVSRIAGSLTLTNIVFSGNMADGHGGGIWSPGGSFTLKNGIFSGNSAGGVGGGVYSSGGSLRNCTFSANTADSGRAAHGTVRMTNCILWDGGHEVSDATITYSNVQGGWPGEGNFFAIPWFVDADGLDDIPGTEDDNLRLLRGSPCIDAGDNGAVTGASDLDGYARFVNDPRTPDTGSGAPPIVDMGAYEFRPGDCAHDGDVDYDDFADFESCLDGPARELPSGCECSDLDGNGRVDLGDFATFQVAFTGP